MSKQTEPTESERKEALKALLLADHGYFSELFLKNEQTGETRVNWFIGIVTGAGGGLVALVIKADLPEDAVRPVVVAALGGLLVFGVVTLFRMIQRNRTTDGYKKDLDSVRQMFRDHFDPDHLMMDYQPLASPRQVKKKELAPNQPPDSSTQEKKKERLPKWIKKSFKLRKFGGLTHTVAAINSVLFAVLAAAIVYPSRTTVPWNAGLAVRLQPATIVAFGAFALSFVVHWLFITWREFSAKQELRTSGVTHAGGVVFKHPRQGPEIEYLLVRPSDKKKKTEWVLPKGHIEDRESHQETALREVQEETGVQARIIGLIGTVEYDADEFVKVKFYLMEELRERAPAEGAESTWREPKWADYKTAHADLTHEESKYLLKLAEERRPTSNV